MNSEWQGFLEQAGAQIEAGAVSHFGDPAAELAAAREQTTLCDLSHEGLIRVSGEESEAFLQGQLSNDIRQVSASAHQLSSYCSPKGRILALFRLFERDQSYYLQLPLERLEPTMKRLRMFVLRSKVEIEDASEQLVRFSLNGPQAEAMLKARLGDVPVEADSACLCNGVTVLRIATAPTHFVLHGEAAPMQALWQSFNQDGAKPAGLAVAQLQAIHAGIPAVFDATAEAFVPQMLNLHRINGVSFKKGCYPGQEVVARMQYLGKLKRRMYRMHADSDGVPQVGDPIHAPTSASGQGAGRIVTVAPAPQGGYDMLVVAEIASAETGELYLDEAHTTPLTVAPLPYSLDPDEETPQAAG
ncbi:MAG: YgfZ/GcvT domain-containing protein [Pseudomonadota bacterium]